MQEKINIFASSIFRNKWHYAIKILKRFYLNGNVKEILPQVRITCLLSTINSASLHVTLSSLQTERSGFMLVGTS